MISQFSAHHGKVGMPEQNHDGQETVGEDA